MCSKYQLVDRSRTMIAVERRRIVIESHRAVKTAAPPRRVRSWKDSRTRVEQPWRLHRQRKQPDSWRQLGRPLRRKRLRYWSQAALVLAFLSKIFGILPLQPGPVPSGQILWSPEAQLE